MLDSKIVNNALTSPIYDLALQTPVSKSPRLSKMLGCNLLLKREDLQPIFSFKIRGAYNKLLRMTPEQRSRGVVAASAGNHAQGVAIAARKLNIPAYIFMPETVQKIKIDAVKALGGNVYLKGTNLVKTLEAVTKYSKQHNLPVIHPFNDSDIITGQATIAAEVLRQISEPIEAIFVATGGGGLLAGIATVIKNIQPQIKVYGVEPVDAASLSAAFAKGKPVMLPYVSRFAETVAVNKVGDIPFKLCQKYVDGVITVNTVEICTALKDIYDDVRAIVEPAGALGVAGAKKYVETGKSKGGTLLTILCGANMNFDMLRYIVERSAAGQGSEMLLGATIPEQPGSFLKFCKALGKRAVTEFNYRYADKDEAHVFAGIELRQPDENKSVLRNLRTKGIKAYDLTGDENTELHIRHMVGGRAKLDKPEHLYRFEFPEKAGALANFLKGLKSNWNISMFHYRFHGADFGRVLAGFQIEKNELPQLEDAFKKIGYTYWPVEKNAAYTMFLKGSSKP